MVRCALDRRRGGADAGADRPQTSARLFHRRARGHRRAGPGFRRTGSAVSQRCSTSSSMRLQSRRRFSARGSYSGKRHDRGRRAARPLGTRSAAGRLLLGSLARSRAAAVRALRERTAGRIRRRHSQSVVPAGDRDRWACACIRSHREDGDRDRSRRRAGRDRAALGGRGPSLRATCDRDGRRRALLRARCWQSCRGRTSARLCRGGGEDRARAVTPPEAVDCRTALRARVLAEADGTSIPLGAFCRRQRAGVPVPRRHERSDGPFTSARRRTLRASRIAEMAGCSRGTNGEMAQERASSSTACPTRGPCAPQTVRCRAAVVAARRGADALRRRAGARGHHRARPVHV